MPESTSPLGRRPLTNPEIALSAVLGIVLPLAGLIVVALAITSTLRHGQRTATIILGVCLVWGAGLLALMATQL